MVWKEGEYWLRDAVKHIKFPPDRRRVGEELYEHMIRRNLDFLANGYSEEEADRRVCEAMGDPEEVGKALAEVHKPFWGYFLRALRILLILVFLFAAISVIKDRGGNLGGSAGIRTRRAEVEARVPVWVAQNETVRLGDYRFHLRKAGITVPERLGGEKYFTKQGTHLVLSLRSVTWDPFLGSPRFDSWSFTVEDSSGREYSAYASYDGELVFVSDLLVFAEDFDPAAEWAVLHFQAGQREFRLPVRLKGARG